MQKDIILKRLAFIKYLFQQANDQANLSEPMCLTSLLIYHDAVELFLQLSAEQFNVNTKNFHFQDYWSKLDPELKKAGRNPLTQAETMRKLNRARVSLKHDGIMPHKTEIENFRAQCNAFFGDNCGNVFAINAEEISLIELVANERAKKTLSSARRYFEDSNHKEAISNLGTAFAVLMHDYEKTAKGKFGESPFYFGEGFSFYGSNFMGLGFSKLGQFVDAASESFTAIQDALGIICLGIDFRKHYRFRLLTPFVHWVIGSDEPVVQLRSDDPISKEDFEFCFDFVIESAIKLQEFQFEMSQ
jgi:hypothetical protein